jgi:hypothetical protein
MLFVAMKATALPPNPPTDFDGPSICTGESGTFLLIQSGGADGFAWEVSGNGWSFESATTTQTFNELTVGTGSATISLWAFNIDGASTTYTTIMHQLGEPTVIVAPMGPHCTSATMTYTTDPVVVADDYHWDITGTDWSISAESGTICDVVGGTGNAVLSFWASNSCGTSSTISISIIPKPAPLSINAVVSGPHCAGTSNTYTIDPVSGATSYTWYLESADAGWSAISSTTTEFEVTSGTATMLPATISVTANNLCGSSATISKVLDPLKAPTGFTVDPPGNHCVNSTRTYTVIPVENATSYRFWFYGSGWSATSNTMGYIEVTSSSLTTGNATLSVAAMNECGSSRTYTTSIVPYYTPATPGPISTVEQHCVGTSRTYTIAPVHQASSYSWTINNPAWSVSGSGTSADIVAGDGSATLSVSAMNNCGMSTPRQVVLTPWVTPASTSITKPHHHCYQDTVRYYAYNDPMATNWTWYVKGSGWSGTSTSRQIDIIAGPGSGTISVVANGPCGSSATYTTTMNPTFMPLSAPERIYQPPSHCAGQLRTYACTPVENATSYTWFLTGSGWEGVSNSNYIDILAGSDTTSISVTANTDCGSSERTTIFVTPGVSPPAPSGITKPVKHCVGTKMYYSAYTVGGNYNYTWSITNSPNATRPWVINTDYGRDIEMTAGSHSATISVYASNACGNGPVYKEVLVPNTPPIQPGAITGPTTHCESLIQRYSIDAVSGATSYKWSVVGSGWSITTSNINQCDILAGKGTGVISVSAVNDCGEGVERTLTVTPDTLLNAPTAINKPATHCVGSIQQYSVTPVPGALSYAWTVNGVNWTYTNSTGPTIMITAGTGDATITAKALNSCGQSPQVSITATSVPLPSSDFNMDRDTICKDETVTVTYNGNAGTGATFDWNFDDGEASPGTGKGPHSVLWYNNPGNRTVRLTVKENGCESDEKTVRIYVRNCTGVNDYSPAKFKVELMPNPSEGIVSLYINNAISDNAEVQIINNLGQIVYSVSLNDVGSQYNRELNLKNLEAGSYYVKVIMKDSEVVKKLVIIK